MDVPQAQTSDVTSMKSAQALSRDHGTNSIIMRIPNGEALFKDIAHVCKLPALHAAAVSGDLAALEQLACASDFNIDVTDTIGNTALNYAMQIGNVDMSVRLLELGSKPGLLNVQGMAPVHVAVQAGQITLLTTLAEAKLIDVNVLSGDGKPPLHLAAQRGDTSACAALIELGANIEMVRSNGLTVMHAAAAGGNIHTCEYLHSLGVPITSAQPLQPLHVAAMHDNAEVCQWLVRKGADASALLHGMAAVHLAAERGFVGVVKAIHSAGGDVSQPAKVRNWTALHFAAANNEAAVFRTLVSLGVSVTASVDVEGETPAHVAACSDADDVMQVICDLYAPLLSVADARGRLPVDVALPWGVCSRRLRKAMSAANGGDDLSNSTSEQDEVYVRRSRNAVELRKAPSMYDVEETTAEWTMFTDLLRDAGVAHKSWSDFNLYDIILQAAKYVMETCYPTPTPPEGSRLDDFWMVVSSLSRSYKSWKTPMALDSDTREVPAETQTQQDTGTTEESPTGCNDEGSEPSIVRLPNDSKLLKLVDGFCNLPAAITGELEELPSTSDVDIHATDASGNTALHYTMEIGNVDMAVCLLLMGSKPDVLNVQGMTPVHVAVQAGQNTLLTTLAEAKLIDVNVLSGDGKPPIYLAAECGDFTMFGTVLKAAANIAMLSSSGLSVMHAAAAGGSMHILNWIHSLGVPVTSEQPLQPLHVAAMHNNANVCQWLIRRGADASAVVDGLTAVHLAAERGFVDVIEFIHRMRVDVSQPAKLRNWTALHFAAANNRANAFHVLAASEVFDIAAVGVEGETPAHVAAWSDADDVMQVICDSFAHLLAIPDARGRLPVDVAPRWGLCSRRLRKAMSAANGADDTLQHDDVYVRRKRDGAHTPQAPPLYAADDSALWSHLMDFWFDAGFAHRPWSDIDAPSIIMRVVRQVFQTIRMCKGY